MSGAALEAQGAGPVTAAKGAGFALLVLSIINLLNYLDRFIISIVLPQVQADFGLSYKQGGLLYSAFIVAFMVASPACGYLGDRLPRRFLVAGGVLLWSLATIASGLAGSFVALLVARTFIGVGEAGYGAVAPSVISDLYPREERTRKLAYFYVAIPVGSALGFALGGWVAEAYSWHAAFFVGGAPGILLGIGALFMAEPRRGAMDGPGAVEKLPFRDGLRGLRRNATFWWTTAGYTLMTFSTGGLGHWMPTFLARERGMSLGDTGFWFGAATASAGLLGTLAGGVVGDKLDRRRAGGGLGLSGWGLVLAAPLMVAAAVVPSIPLVFLCIFLAQFFIWLNSGPINATIVNCVPPAFRAFAMGLNVLFIHALGDAISPTVIGAIGDASSLGMAIKLNALPVLLGGLALLVASRAWRTASEARTAT